MIDFSRSTFTWKGHRHESHPHYRWPGGFVGEPGQVYQVRFNLVSKCEVTEEATAKSAELFLGASCRTEYTIARRNLFQIPSSEWRFAFSRRSSLTIAKRPSKQEEPAAASNLSDSFQDFRIDLRSFSEAEEIRDAARVVEATLNNDVLNACSTYRDSVHGFTVRVEYPVNLINVNSEDAEFQVCTGPVLLPDLATWNGEEVERVFVAYVAITAFDFVEFILRREVAAAPEERAWLEKPRGRDRHELIDPMNEPPGYPPERPKPTVYNETWELDAANVILRALNA